MSSDARVGWKPRHTPVTIQSHEFTVGRKLLLAALRSPSSPNAWIRHFTRTLRSGENTHA